jgi:hypothetical protein
MRNPDKETELLGRHVFARVLISKGGFQMSFLKKAPGIVLCVVIGMMVPVFSTKRFYVLEDMAKAQDPASLDRRISLVEQRLFLIESSITRLQQSAITQRLPSPEPSSRERQIILLNEDLQKLSLRVSELECGLVKVDERTTVRDSARRTETKPADPCRLNPATPIRLSTRP